MALAVRRDAKTPVVATNGRYTPLAVNEYGALWVDMSQPVALAADTSVSLAAGVATIGKVGIDPANNTVAFAAGSTVALAADASVALSAGSNLIGKVGIDQTTPGANAVSNKGQVLTNSTSTAYEASRILKASAGTLFGITGYNSKTTKQYILFFDSATLPADGTAAIQTIPVPSDSPFALDFGANGRTFANGIVFCNSSTPRIKTLGAADCTFDAQVL
jgi:hypothetical protein